MKKTAAASKSHRPSKTGQRSSPWTWFWVGLIGIAIVASLARAFYLYQGSAGSSAAEITAAAAYTRYQAGADYFLDVRTPEEWTLLHLQNSTLIPLADLPGRLNELPRDRKIVVVCATGSRSRQALGILQTAGLAQAVSMKGGLTAWEAAGYPVVTAP
jgi:rhodanese-related sulfurtransferase